MRKVFTLILLTLVLTSAGCAASAPAKGEYWCRGVPVEDRKQVAVEIQTQIKTAARELGLQPISPEIIIKDYLAVVVAPRHKIKVEEGRIIYRPLTLEEIAEIETDPTSILPSLRPGDWSVGIVQGLGYQQARTLPFRESTITLGASAPKVMTRVAAHEWVHALLEGSPLDSASFLDPVVQKLEEIAVEVIAKEIAAKTCTKHGKGCEFPLACEEAYLLLPEINQLLSEGRIEEAEALLEKMRPKLCPTDWCPYRINQASFAVILEACEDYRAESGDWWRMQELRAQYPTPGEFLDDIKQVESYEDFLDLCEEHGISPDE